MSKEISKEISKQLAKCPFCGGEARLQKKNRKRGWYVICKNTNCGCRTPFYQHQYTSEEDLRTIATMVWNTRKSIDRIVERLEEELHLSDKEKERCIYENPLQFDEAKGYARGIANAIEIVRECNG